VPAGGIALGGSGRDRTVTVTPAPGKSGTAVVTVVVRDANGGTRSDTFAVTVPPPGGNTVPSITNITDRTIATGQSTGPVPFTVGDVESPPDQLALAATSSDEGLVPLAAITFGGSGASRTVTVTPAAGRTGTAVVTVRVTDPGGLSTSD